MQKNNILKNSFQLSAFCFKHIFYICRKEQKYNL